MFHYGRIPYIYPCRPGNQRLYESLKFINETNLPKRIDNYRKLLLEPFHHFLRIYENILNLLNDDKMEYKDMHSHLRYVIIRQFEIISELNIKKYENILVPKNIYSCEEIINITNEYSKKIHNRGLNLFLSFFDGCVDSLRKNSELGRNKYSFHEGTKILLKKKFCLQEAIHAIIQMLFAVDNFNMDGIMLLRNYLINSKMASLYLHMNVFDNNDKNHWFSIFESDICLIKDILNIYYSLNLDKSYDSLYYDIPLEKEGELNIIAFDYVCMLIYARHVISIYISLIEYEWTMFFEDKKIEQTLINVHRALGLLILNSVYKNLSVFEFVYFSNIELLNDILVNSHAIITETMFIEERSILSSISSIMSHTDYSDIIIKMTNYAKKKWDNGDERHHIEMINHLKKLKKYKDYLLKRGVEEKVRKALIKLCEDNHYMRIYGVNYFPSRRRRRKKKSPEKNNLS